MDWGLGPEGMNIVTPIGLGQLVGYLTPPPVNSSILTP